MAPWCSQPQNMPWNLLNSFGHMLFVWGLSALAFLLIVRARHVAHGRISLA